jgi:hypothetical protein
MAYNNGFPINYQYAQPIPQYNYVPQMQQQQIMSQQQIPQQVVQQPVNDTGILWVQGEAGAKSWAVAPGKSVMLMDSESNTFYIKSSDQSGMPMPLRIFDYTERTAQQNQSQLAQHQELDTSQFVTWDKLDERITQKLDEFTRPSGGKNND